MDKKNIAVLIIITLLVVVIAMLLVQRREAATSDDALGALFFRDLEQKLDDVAVVEIVQGKDRVTLQRDGETWRIKEKGGYAADFDKLKSLVLSIANLLSVEGKTSKADQYDKLGVTDPAAEDATHPGVTLKDANGTILAALVIGDAHDSDDGVKKQLYVRRLNDTQAWLVEGKVEVLTDAAAWLRKDRIADIFRSRMKSLDITLPDGAHYLVTKTSRDEKGFQYSPMPRNFKIRSQARLDDMSAALENVVPDDAIVADSFQFPATGVGHNEYRTFDGVVVKAALLQKDNKWYVKYEVAFDLSVAGTPSKSGGAVGESEKVKQEAESLAQNLKGWVFVLPEAKANLMIKKISDVLVPSTL